MMQKPLLPVTVKDEKIDYLSSHCDRCVCAYILFICTIIIVIVSVVIYFNVNQTVFRGDE
jgi:ABC-type uncharacterized transport system permease subunit